MIAFIKNKLDRPLVQIANKELARRETQRENIDVMCVVTCVIN